MENYITKMKQILDKTNWSQARLAQEIGVTFTTVNRWLKGHTKPHPAQIRQINRLYKEIVGILPLQSSEINQILEDVLKEKKRFSKIEQLLQKKAIQEEFLLELTYNSDAIEGSTLSKKETEAIIFDKATIKDKSLIEHLEATNHAAILRDIFDNKITVPISEDLIKNLHKILMQGIRDDAGEYSKYHRAIRGVNLALPSPLDIPEEMKLLCKNINSYQDNPIGHIAKMHASFEAIHPFGDGNGRIGRIIMIIQLIHCGFAPCAISVNQKAKYYECLEYAQKRSETHLVYFLAESILKGYEIIKKSAYK